jgi:uncharacterized protein YndB with AHSA1/START domain
VIQGDDVVHEVAMAATPDAVFEMFVDPAKLVRWIGISADLDPRPGGRFRFEVAPGEFCEGEYREIDRPHRVVFTWGWTSPAMHVPPGSSLVEVDLAADGDGGTLVRLVHRRLPGSARAMHDDGWTHFLDRLTGARLHGARS